MMRGLDLTKKHLLFLTLRKLYKWWSAEGFWPY